MGIALDGMPYIDADLAPSTFVGKDEWNDREEFHEFILRKKAPNYLRLTDELVQSGAFNLNSHVDPSTSMSST